MEGLLEPQAQLDAAQWRRVTGHTPVPSKDSPPTLPQKTWKEGCAPGGPLGLQPGVCPPWPSGAHPTPDCVTRGGGPEAWGTTLPRVHPPPDALPCSMAPKTLLAPGLCPHPPLGRVLVARLLPFVLSPESPTVHSDLEWSAARPGSTSWL